MGERRTKEGGHGSVTIHDDRLSDTLINIFNRKNNFLFN